QDAPPALAVHHLSATPRGILCALALDDPAELVRELRLDRGGAVARLANRLQRRLQAQQNRAWDFDLEEGTLDAGRLARVV
ncbi:hypothetical protein RCK87_26740, partial [Salmonella enterica subsp. enterica serovar 1,4,[5],12:i:-]